MIQRAREALFCNDRLPQRRFAVAGALLIAVQLAEWSSGTFGKIVRLIASRFQSANSTASYRNRGPAVQL